MLDKLERRELKRKLNNASVRAELLSMFIEWQTLAYSKDVEHTEAVSTVGLCDWFIGTRSGRMLGLLLLRDFNTSLYPFGQRSYWARERNRSAHKCPARRRWVKKIIKELKSYD